MPPPGVFDIDRNTMTGKFRFPDGIVRPVHFAKKCRLQVDANGMGMSFRPLAEPKLWGIVFGVLSKTNGCLFWPDCDHIPIGRAEAEQHIPPDMIESLGPIRLYRSAAELAAPWTKGRHLLH